MLSRCARQTTKRWTQLRRQNEMVMRGLSGTTTPPPAAAAAAGEKKKKLWGGAFGEDEGPDPVMEAFNASIGFDKKLCFADVAGSKAYARALGRSGVLSGEEVREMEAGLEAVRQEWAEGRFEIEAGDEDIHTANERRLGEIKGTDLAGRLHTGRSRNDQVATDIRLWLRGEIFDLRKKLRTLIETARDVANDEAAQNAAMPGYTHLQRAQPIRWSHFVLSHAWAWTRDCDRLDGVFSRSDVCPLGSGALAGHPFFPPGERDILARDLGFSGGITQNSVDSVSDRDFCVEFAQWSALLGAHLARWAEDLIIYGSSEFGFVKFGGRYSTGSSLMPQKRNPDALELIRGKSARLQAASTQLIALVSKLPAAYNKDLQEDKEAVFDVADTLRLLLPVADGVLRTLTIDADKMRAALVPAMLATDLAEYLVRKGVPFRETHHVAGRAVRLANESDCTIADLSLSQLQSLHPAFSQDVTAIFDFDASLQVRNADGGTSLRSQKAQINALDNWLDSTRHLGPTPESAAVLSS